MNKSQLNEFWYRGCTGEEDRKKRESTVTSNYASLSVLYDLLLIEKEILEQKLYSTQNYDKASWAYSHADTLGELRTINRLLKTLGPFGNKESKTNGK